MKIQKLLCLGDSLIEGYNIEQSTRWTDLLQNQMNVDVVNCGISGDTTTGMLARCERILLEHKPSHLIILGGTNDLWFGLKDEFIISNIHAMSRQARYHGVESIVGIPTPSFNLNELNVVHENYSECIRSFQRTLIDHCVEDEKLYINFSLNMKTEHFLEDGVHPNEEGQKLMAENARQQLEKFN